MKRKHKKYSKPKRPFDKARINEEAEIKKNYGLKNKREIWKAESKVKSMREKAKRLIGSSTEKQQSLFNQLKKMGLQVNSISDVLSLDKKDYLDRRLQTILVKRKLTTTSKSARQMIIHKKVLVKGEVVNSPSYIVPVELEEQITLKKGKEKKVPKKEFTEEKEADEKIQEEVKENNPEKNG